MSGEWGRPVRITHGERLLLIDLLNYGIKHLEERAPAVPPLGGPRKEAERLRKLRIRQYARLRFEILKEFDNSSAFPKAMPDPGVCQDEKQGADSSHETRQDGGPPTETAQ